MSKFELLTINKISQNIIEQLQLLTEIGHGKFMSWPIIFRDDTATTFIEYLGQAKCISQLELDNWEQIKNLSYNERKEYMIGLIVENNTSY